MTKTIFIFIALKLAEIGGIVFLPWLIGREVVSRLGDGREPVVLVWLLGFVALMVPIAALFLCVVAVYKNWQWAQALAGGKP